MYYKEEHILRDRKRFRYHSIYNGVPKEILVSPEDLYVLTTDADRLDLLALQYYGNAKLWRLIAWANPIIGNGSIFLNPGIQLRIPQGDQIDEIIQQLRSNS